MSVYSAGFHPRPCQSATPSRPRQSHCKLPSQGSNQPLINLSQSHLRYSDRLIGARRLSSNPTWQCHAATQLATYDLLTTRSLSELWFQRCVQKLVGKLQQAPFLHIVHSIHLQREDLLSISEDTSSSPQLWAQLAQGMSESPPEALILAHRVDCLEDVCIARKAARRRSGARTASASDCAAGMSAAADSRPTTMAGHVGEDCCDGAHAVPHHGGSQPPARPSININSSSTVPHALVHAHVQRNDAQDGWPPGGAVGGGCAAVQYHGLVVQSPVFKDVEGCYLLKTEASADAAGCRCMHFTLTKVCLGAPLSDQLHSSWLAAA